MFDCQHRTHEECTDSSILPPKPPYQRSNISYSSMNDPGLTTHPQAMTLYHLYSTAESMHRARVWIERLFSRRQKVCARGFSARRRHAMTLSDLQSSGFCSVSSRSSSRPPFMLTISRSGSSERERCQSRTLLLFQRLQSAAYSAGIGLLSSSPPHYRNIY